MRKVMIVNFVAVTSFLLGGAFMYLVDTAWVDETRRSNQNKLNSMKLQYSDALNVSNALVNNCYAAFYVVSKCSTKEGCNFESTISSLIELNIERKFLKLELDQLLEGADSSLLKESTL